MEEITVGIRDLKTRLSEYLRMVRNGQTIVITDHGRLVGRILPVEEDLDENIQELIQAGAVAWNGKKLGPLHKPLVNQSNQLASDILIEMRA